MSPKSRDGGTLAVNSGYLYGSGLGVSIFSFYLAFIYLFINSASIYFN